MRINFPICKEWLLGNCISRYVIECHWCLREKKLELCRWRLAVMKTQPVSGSSGTSGASNRLVEVSGPMVFTAQYYFKIGHASASDNAAASGWGEA